jgi:hypothetical protein
MAPGARNDATCRPPLQACVVKLPALGLVPETAPTGSVNVLSVASLAFAGLLVPLKSKSYLSARNRPLPSQNEGSDVVDGRIPAPVAELFGTKLGGNDTS